jgi:hypothetical protein
LFLVSGAHNIFQETNSARIVEKKKTYEVLPRQGSADGSDPTHVMYSIRMLRVENDLANLGDDI